MDVERIRADFPILSRKFSGKTLAYLDNAATTQKPAQVLGAVDAYYRHSNSNINRGAYRLGVEATEAYESARKNVAAFINAKPDEIIFTRNATESLNLVAHVTCQGAKKGGRVLLTQMEHHSNIVPWQLAAGRQGLKIGYVKVRGYGKLCNSDVDEGLASRPFILSFTHASNVLGAVNDAKAIARRAKKAGALVCLDGAQSAPHLMVDVKEIGCDFFAFSGHKMLGPMGIGVLYMKRELQEALPPFLGGGDMIKSVSFEKSTWKEPPHKFEAGTPNVAGAVGLSAAIDYLRGIGMASIAGHEKKLARLCREELGKIATVRFHGPARGTGIVSFNVGKIHAHDISTFADDDAIAIRAGQHCAEPLVRLLGETATARASFYLYNTEEEVGRLASSVKRAQKRLG